jgi:hypothetical protein
MRCGVVQGDGADNCVLMFRGARSKHLVVGKCVLVVCFVYR